MTHPPPPDPLWQPSPAPTDAVLQPPPPLPWEQQVSEPAAPPPPVSAPPAAPSYRIRSTRAAARPTAPIHAPHGTTTPTWQPEPVRRKARRWPIIGIIVAALVLCGGVIVSGSAVLFGTVVSGPDGSSSGPLPEIEEQPAIAAPTPSPSGSDAPAVSFGAPTAVVDGGPDTSFDLAVGTGVRFSDQDGTWTVALLGVEWVEACEDLLGGALPAVVFDIQYEVTEGGVSIIPLAEFAFALTDGTTARVGLLPACAEPPLDYTTIYAGTVHRGRIAVELPAGARRGGALTYGQLGEPTASWTVLAHAGD